MAKRTQTRPGAFPRSRGNENVGNLEDVYEKRSRLSGLHRIPDKGKNEGRGNEKGQQTSAGNAR